LKRRREVLKMKMQGNTILITGGATGIGLALAKSFIEKGNEVVICARTGDHLNQAKEGLPKLHIKRCDLSKESERRGLHDWMISNFPETNILVNNAGIQRMIDLRKGMVDIDRLREIDGEDEIEINFRAYVHLAAAFVPDLMKRDEAAIVNVSSGLGFIPLAITPIYCATKAAIHSFSLSLRHQLRDTSIKVFEIIPPTVDTELDKGARAARGQQDRGIPPSLVARETMPRIEIDDFEIAIGRAENILAASRTDFERIFVNMNKG
jgi:uncharacterized oxidoreductase